MIKIDVTTLPVVSKECKTCPFKKLPNGSWQNPELANTVITRTLFKGNQICHSTESENRKPNNRCRGSYDYNRMIYKRLGLDITLMK